MSTSDCTHNPCKFIHDPDLCASFYSKGTCDGFCEKNHFIREKTFQKILILFYFMKVGLFIRKIFKNDNSNHT